eukprot:4289060-Karenia_brevis.AAC.1
MDCKCPMPTRDAAFERCINEPSLHCEWYDEQYLKVITYAELLNPLVSTWCVSLPQSGHQEAKTMDC